MAVDSANCQSSVGKKLPATSYGTVEERDSLLALLMNWLSQLLSQCSCSTQSQQNSSCRQGRQLLPLVAKLLPNLPPSHHLPLLKLTLWTIKILPEVGTLCIDGCYKTTADKSSSAVSFLTFHMYTCVHAHSIMTVLCV